MAPSKLAVPSIFLALIFSQIRAEIPIPEWGRAVPSPGSFLSSSANPRVYWVKFVIFQVFVDSILDPSVFQMGSVCNSFHL
ncbi:hypothetical protein D8674_040000 [Pyrus ussuriensis x Pyrus communis]|uniref:Uncharacterized protein n=1 Tax=Pyrus ussuriensis x Pyrus communis TaxID=2448454 RepID=A0A5N5GX66_9ROSA|nr:hypothetical protein D8674_040000 [Pyrus ussuriensis x Pyrus communis]